MPADPAASPSHPELLSSSRSLSEQRSRARQLLRQLRAADAATARAAAERFRALRSFAIHSAEELMSGAVRVQLKHALTVVAVEAGATSWLALKAAAALTEPAAQLRPKARRADETFLYERGLSVLLNRWFASYEEAKASLAADGGYLLPYRQQFYICEAEGIRVLGLDPDDADWQRIGWNWIEPADREARARLAVRRAQAIRAAEKAAGHP